MAESQVGKNGCAKQEEDQITKMDLRKDHNGLCHFFHFMNKNHPFIRKEVILKEIGFSGWKKIKNNPILKNFYMKWV